jgi:hypothetical protein
VLLNGHQVTSSVSGGWVCAGQFAPAENGGEEAEPRRLVVSDVDRRRDGVVFRQEALLRRDLSRPI